MTHQTRPRAPAPLPAFWLAPLLAFVVALVPAAPGHSAGLDPVRLGAEGPWIVLPAGSVVDIAPLSDSAIAALADLDGDPSVTTSEERAMMAVLRQVLGLPLDTDAPGMDAPG